MLKTETLAHFIVNTAYEDIPLAIQQKAIRHILDTLGAGIAGAISIEAQTLTKTLSLAGEKGDNATLWGQPTRASLLNAALINGTASHAFELDDTGGCDHSGAVVMPALLAAVEHVDRPVSGKELITAMVMGYDIARRALEACGTYEPHNRAGFHSTGTCGTFGAAAAAGMILGLNEKEMVNALGLAASYSSGLWACVHDGAQSKRLHAGHAAQGGLMAALLAKEGFTGPAHIFEEVWGGFNHSFAPNSSDPDAWTRGLGEPWRLHRVSIKPHASCRSTHAAIDAVNNILANENITDIAEIDSIEIIINPFVYGMCGARNVDPMNSAQLSIAYSIAARLLYGTASLSSFTQDKRHDPRIEPLMNLVSFTVDKSQKDDDEPIVKLTLKNGSTFTEHVPMPLGAPTNPVTDEALIGKFKDVSSMVLPMEKIDLLVDNLMGLENISNVKEEIIASMSSEILQERFNS